MFQYALGRSLSLSHNVPFKIDSSYLRSANQSDRSFQLDKFNTTLEEATSEEINKYRSTFQKILDKMRPESKRKKIVEHSQFFKKNILNRADGYFDGHWNSEKYFNKYEDAVRKDFELKAPFGSKASEISQKIISEQNAISLHIRRGDYVSNKKIANIYNTLPLSYYEQAMKKINEKTMGAHFFIFSDDMDWVRKNFSTKYSVTFVSSPEIADYEEITLMSQCKHNIIANSTFSWWGAWLNPSSQKVVIAPAKWLNTSPSKYTDVVPNSWIKI